MATWEVRDDGRLFLDNITAADFRTDVPISSAFPDKKGPFHATWYNGTMENPRVLLHYVHGGVGGYFLYWKTFTFRNGKLVSTGIRPGLHIIAWLIILSIVFIPLFIAPILWRIWKRTRRKKRATTDSVAAPIWYFGSTRIAFSIILFYSVFIFRVPLFPIIVETGGMIRDLIHLGIPIAMIFWTLALTLKHRRCRLSTPQLIWTGFCYGAISLTLTSSVIMIACASSGPRHVRYTSQLRWRMSKQADVPAIRAWAISYEPTEQEVEYAKRDTGLFVMHKNLPRCISKLKPDRVLYSKEKRTVHLIYGDGYYDGDFGNWGLSIGPKEVKPPGDNYEKTLEDGAWVWQNGR
jgi:hypothetical protein